MTKLAVLLLAGCAMITGAMAQSEGTTQPPAVQAAPDQGATPGTEIAPTPEEAAPPPTTARVHVIVENVETDAGRVWVALCDTALSIEGCPYKKDVAAAVGFVEVTFEDIPPGAYAVAGYHDIDGNNEFDKTLGVPREPYALSGPAGEMLVPKLKDAVLPINLGDNEVTIRLHGVID